MATNTADYALVIGIGRYADAADPSGWIGNLNGPDNDAAAVAEWLRHPNGGDLPDENICVVRSADFPDPFTDGDSVGPQQRAIEEALNDLADLPTTAYDGQYAGRRVYIYASGHGFGRTDDEAAIVTAEAKRTRPLNVLVTSWVSCLKDAARFQEYVLWVDACATRRPLSFLKPCDREQEVSANAGSVRQFRAFAAGYNQLAVEAQLGGEWHGVFTYALLKALRGAAPRDANGTITSDGVRDYLRNNMASFMTDRQRADGRVAREPSFAKTDPMTFASPAQPLLFGVTLRFPATAVGHRATVSTDGSSPLVAETTLATTDWKLQLVAGAYVAFLPELNTFSAFAVTGGDPDQVVAIH
jgi:uncharacterized caspase-like protein